jgi:histidyl-tRNA synthetase
LEIVSVGGSVGSICGGGRYDDLVGMFSGKKIPSCGASIGIERVLLLMEQKYSKGYDVRET